MNNRQKRKIIKKLLARKYKYIPWRELRILQEEHNRLMNERIDQLFLAQAARKGLPIKFGAVS